MRIRTPIAPGRLQHIGPIPIPGIGPRALTLYHPPSTGGAGAIPLAVLFDGQNLFRDEGSFAGGWHLHLALDRLATAGKKVPMVVGIHHGGVERIDELTPWKTREGGGRANVLIEWISDRLMVQLRRDHPLLAGPEHTLIGGSSMGGLAALFAICHRPDVFGRVLAMSPSLWVGDGEIFREVARARIPTSSRIYLDAGHREGFMLQHAHQMARLLVRKGLEPDRQLMWRPDRRGSHNERAWRRRLPKALRFLQYGQRHP